MNECFICRWRRWWWLRGSPRGLLQSLIIIIMSPSGLIQKLLPVGSQRVCRGRGGHRYGGGHRLHTCSCWGATGIRPTALSCGRLVVVLLTAVVVSMDLPSGRVVRGGGVRSRTEGDAGRWASWSRGVWRARNGLLQVRNIGIHCRGGVILCLMREKKDHVLGIMSASSSDDQQSKIVLSVRKKSYVLLCKAQISKIIMCWLSLTSSTKCTS